MPRHGGSRAPRRALLVAGFVACGLGLAAWLLFGSSPGSGAVAPIIVGAPAGSTSSSPGQAAGSLGPAPSLTASVITTAASGRASAAATKAKAAASSAAATSCSTPGACGFPDAESTGPRTASFASHSGNVEIKQNGEVISGWDLSGSLDVYANDVTVIDTRITSTNWWAVNLRPGYTGLRILHSRLTGTPGAGPDNGGEDYAVSDMGDGTIEVGWDDVSVFADALSMGHGYIHDDYVHDIVPFINRSGGYAHLDAVISDGDDTLGLRVVHNTLLNPVPVGQGTTSVIGLLPNTGPISNTTISDNWLAGGGYTVYGGGSGATGVVVTGNIFSTVYAGSCGFYGPVAYWNAGGSGNQWSNNKLTTGTQVVPAT
ncbi:hypothetical protein KDL01_18265 [Actinospica durhamensis]|uniref:Right-handed parallel beta-helix repeat-containing protein n=1 Tax=Actinospica durhamensis TaxID=1508375 RepID=A0A941EUC5_9ACTN|nr:hypothetical protein [Actinospica durhamensis]MBR7835224.1 hypothetical protein [Actinospica durhamensis]